MTHSETMILDAKALKGGSWRWCVPPDGRCRSVFCINWLNVLALCTYFRGEHPPLSTEQNSSWHWTPLVRGWLRDRPEGVWGVTQSTHNSCQGRKPGRSFGCLLASGELPLQLSVLPMAIGSIRFLFSMIPYPHQLLVACYCNSSPCVHHK